MPNTKETLVELSEQLRYCAVDDDCINCKRWDFDCGSRHCLDDLMLKASELLKSIANGITVKEWISVQDRLPSKEEYTAKIENGTEYYKRLLIAYKTDIIEYEIGYYDGYKWMTEMPIRLIKDVVAWMPFPNMPQPPKGE